MTTTGATVSTPNGVAVDPAAGRIYWANAAGNKISSAGLGGGGGFDLPTLTATVDNPGFPSLLRAPAAAGAPTVSGAGAPGSTLSCSQGAWAPDLLGSFLYRAPATFAYHWLRDGSPISGATQSTFSVDTAGSYACRVTATNHAGSSSQTSASTAVFVLGKTKLNKRKGTASIRVDVPGSGTLKLSGKDVASQSQSVSAGTTKLTVKAKGKAAKTLGRKGKVTVNPKITFTPTGGPASTQDETVGLKKAKKKKN